MLAVIFAFSAMQLTAQEEEKESKEKKEHRCKHSGKNYMDGFKIEKFGDDSLVIYLNKDRMDRMSFPDFPPFFCKKNRYNGHWAGVGLGFNGYVNSDFNMDLDPKYAYMNLNTARSLVININPVELNLNLIKNRFGLTSGIGFQLSNYYFTGNYALISDSASLVAFKITDANRNEVDLVRNKLFVSYLNIPILFEYQTNSRHRLNSFHVALGVIGGVRIGSYTKQVYHNWNQTYYLTNEQGQQIASYYTDKHYSRRHDPYHLQAFKLDATMRIGWSFLNFWATYSLTPMFQKNKGPELYPWTIGIQLAGW